MTRAADVLINAAVQAATSVITLNEKRHEAGGITDGPRGMSSQKERQRGRASETLRWDSECLSRKMPPSDPWRENPLLRCCSGAVPEASGIMSQSELLLDRGGAGSCEGMTESERRGVKT